MIYDDVLVSLRKRNKECLFIHSSNDEYGRGCARTKFNLFPPLSIICKHDARAFFGLDYEQGNVTAVRGFLKNEIIFPAEEILDFADLFNFFHASLDPSALFSEIGVVKKIKDDVVYFYNRIMVEKLKMLAVKVNLSFRHKFRTEPLENEKDEILFKQFFLLIYLFSRRTAFGTPLGTFKEIFELETREANETEIRWIYPLGSQACHETRKTKKLISSPYFYPLINSLLSKNKFFAPVGKNSPSNVAITELGLVAKRDLRIGEFLISEE